MSRLLHDVAQLAGQGQLTVSLHPTRLHEHELAAQGGPRQPHRHAGQREPLRHLRHKQEEEEHREDQHAAAVTAAGAHLQVKHGRSQDVLQGHVVDHDGQLRRRRLL